MPFNSKSDLARLIAAPVRAGVVAWIGMRPARRAAMVVLESGELEEGRGLRGDRYGAVGGNRQVTLIEAESLASIASHLGLSEVPPDDLRRNIVVRGMNLLALKGRRFELGEALLEATGECHPCSRMEQILGTGGYNAVRGLGGITARVLRGGHIAIGDRVSPVASDEAAEPR